MQIKMKVWTPVKDNNKYGIVVSNLKHNIVLPHRLSLNVGDTVYIQEECDEWYHGCNLKQRSHFGIFPKAYICLKEAVVDKTGAQEIVIPREPPIIQEITSILREWGVIWKQLYVNNNMDFKIVREMMTELIDYRKQIMSGTLPADELKEIKHKVTSKIDQGNAILGLDLVVRDEHGNILNPEITSTIDLYRAHEAATRRIKQIAAGVDTRSQKSTISKHSYNLFVTLKNFVCKIGEDADLLMSLYDAKEGKFISENYLVTWGKGGLVKDVDQMNNLIVVFADLGSKDLARERVFLVCHVIRLGGMELKDPDPKMHRKSSLAVTKKASDSLRRPFGVAAMDITDIISGKINVTESDEEKQHFIPFVPCGEKDSLDALIRKVLSSVREVKDCKGQGLFISLRMLQGDQKQIREEFAHLVSPFTAVARKMGFPEVILPGDVRNDLYLTLVQGEFSKGSKSSERNVEVTVKVCGEKGVPLEKVLSVGVGSEDCFMTEYKSVVYYHEERPKWMETVKVSMPIDDFKNAHLKFTFRHRSSNESKDKSEKPFAVAYIKLMNDNGTTLRDQMHELLVYKVDHKKFDDTDIAYMKFPSTKAELEAKLSSSNQNLNQIGTKQLSSMFQSNGINLSPKDSFNISTIVCSTKLTQHIDLLGLLNWKSNKENLKSTLEALMKVDGEEIVKFLQDIFDALFDILVQNIDSDEYDNLVFEALIFIIGLISEKKYQHFRTVMDAYISNNFSATLIYNKLIAVLKSYIDNASDSQMRNDQDILLRAMKSLEYIFKFIVRSRQLFAALNGGRGKTQFEESLLQLLQSITCMMRLTSDSSLIIQGTCLKYFPSAISDILCVFDEKKLSYFLTDLINNIAVDRLTTGKMLCINEIVHCELFAKYPDCRKILLPVINEYLRLLLNKKNEFELCVKILSDILVVLHGRDANSTQNDIEDIMLSILRTIIQTVIEYPRNDPLIGNLVALMIEILRQMTQHHYQEYIQHFPTRTDLLDFLMEILLIFRDLVSNKVFPSDWNEMIMLQNSVILNSLRHFAKFIRDQFTNPFEPQVWKNFFECAIAFLTQDALQLEKFSQSKQNKIISRYRDMRRETAFEIRGMWFNLGGHKIYYIPDMVGAFLEMSLIPEKELRIATIPIFFDMMQCEFYATKKCSRHHPNECSCVKQRNEANNRSSEIRGNFHEFENAMITHLDALIEGGRGDEQFKDLFHQIVGTQCEHHTVMRELGLFFVKTVVRLMRRLLEYRSVARDENKENRMVCTVNLLEFYNEINRKEMYIRYLYKLCDLHLECDNFIEAAYTLGLHVKLLKWSEEGIHYLLKNEKYNFCQTQRQLKERLFYDIIDYFDRGKLWEAGLSFCKELAHQYECEVFDYVQLSGLHQRMATFFDNIMKQARPEPEYFRVAYYGRGFPAFLQNKAFVYRGKEYERLSEFSGRLLNQFPNAQLLTKLGYPGEEITEAQSGQYLQINKVNPAMHDPNKFKGKTVHDQILRYYKVNEVQKFTYSRPVRKGEKKDSDNEFANMWIEKTTLSTSYSLPGILRRFPVIETNTIELSPLENAIESMESTNSKLLQIGLQHFSDQTLPINPLSMTLNGIVDAAVMGGIINYEKAFFTDDYMMKHQNYKEKEGVNKLKNLIAEQIPLLKFGILLHGQKAPMSLRPFHDHLEEAFNKLKNNVEEKYGTKDYPPEISDCIVKMRSFERTSLFTHSSCSIVSNEHRTSTGSTIGNENTPNKSNPGRSVSVWVKSPSGQTPTQSALGFTSNTLIKLRKQTSRDGFGSFTRRSNQETSSGNSQWYTDKSILLANQDSNPVIELNEPLTPHRPMRPETDKRVYRPNSGTFRSTITAPTPTRSLSQGAPMNSFSPYSSNCISPSSHDDTPPPLPAKHCADYSNTNEGEHTTNGVDLTVVPARRNSALTSPSRSKPPPPLPKNEPSPPISPRISSSPPELPKKPQKLTLAGVTSPTQPLIDNNNGVDKNEFEENTNF